MQKLRYEGNDINLNDPIEIKLSEAKKGTVVNLTKNDEDEIYRQDKDFIRDLEDKVFSKRALYKQKAPSARHSGLRPLMVSILSLIHKASQIARTKHKDFYGLTLYECQKAMKMCNVSNHTVRDNLRKLVKLDLVEKKFVHIDGQTRRDTFYDLKLSDKTVPCKDGAYIVFNENYGSKGLFILNCLDEDTLITTRRGRVKIKEITSHDEVLSLDMSGDVLKEYYQPIKILAKRTGYAWKIKLEDGRELIASDDHPFLTWDGNDLSWTKLKDIDPSSHLLFTQKNYYRMDDDNREIISINDLISVAKDRDHCKQYIEVMKLSSQGMKYSEIASKLGIRYSKVQSWVSRGYVPRGIQKINELRNMELFPLTYNDDKSLILARLVGWLLCDGNLGRMDTTSRKLTSCGQDFENKEVAKDLDKLGIKYRLDTQCRVVVDSMTITLLFRALGMVEGDKAVTRVSVPNWIKNGTLDVKREFISGVFGADSSTPGFRKYNKTLYSIRFGQRKWVDIEDSMQDFMEDIASILDEFGIDTIIQRKDYDVRMRKDGNETVRYDIYVTNKYENILRFTSHFNFAYSPIKDRESERVQAYLNFFLMSKKSYQDRVQDKLNQAQSLLDLGMTYQDTSDEIDMKMNTLYDRIHNPKEEYHDHSIPYYDDMRNGIPIGDIVKTVRVEYVEYVGERVLYDITTEANEDGNFFANGIQSHNCPEYPYCSLRRKDCRIVYHLKTLANMLPNYIKSMEGQEMDIPDIPEIPHKNESTDSDETAGKTIVRRAKLDTAKSYTDLSEQEKYVVDKMIYDMRNQDHPTTYNECIRLIAEKHDVNVTRYNVYQITKGDSPRPVMPDPVKFTDIESSLKSDINTRIFHIRNREDPPTYKECSEIIMNEYNVEVDKNVIYNAVKNAEDVSRDTTHEKIDEDPRDDADEHSKEVVKYVDLPDDQRDQINDKIISLRDDGTTYKKCISIIKEENCVIVNRNTIYNVATKGR